MKASVQRFFRLPLRCIPYVCLCDWCGGGTLLCPCVSSSIVVLASGVVCVTVFDVLYGNGSCDLSKRCVWNCLSFISHCLLELGMVVNLLDEPNLQGNITFFDALDKVGLSSLDRFNSVRTLMSICFATLVLM